MKIIAVYPGRFQPFHKGHAQVYKWLKEKFGNAHIATSDKVEAPKSPFNFDEKKKMMELAGVSPSDIYQVRNPYIAPEVLRHYDGTKTVLVFAVSEKDMAEDPRFSFKPTKSGKPGYLQPYPKDGKGLEPFGDPDKPRGYVVTTPTFTFNVLGEPSKSATEVRKQFANADHETQKKLIKDLFGKYDAKVHKLMDEKIKGALNAAPKPKSIKQIREEPNDNDSSRPIVDPNEPNTPMGKFLRKYTPLGDVQDVATGIQQGDVKKALGGAASLGAQALTGTVGTAAKIAVGAARGAGIMEDIGQLDHEKFGPMLDTFVQFASKKLGIQSLPQISLQKGEMQTSFGGYSPQNKSIVVITKNRHPMDVYRTVAHELVHHKQNEDGNLGKDIAAEGSTGSPTENEANAEAGKIMRWFAKKNPDSFKSGQIVESVIEEGLNDPSRQKAVFLAGGPGSGKDFIMQRTLHGHGMREVNSDTALEYLMDKEGLSKRMPPEERTARDVVRGRAKKVTKEKERNAIAGRQGLIINGTADDPEKIMKIKGHLEDNGYDTMMVYVDTSNPVSRDRNIQRGKEGGREVPEDIRQQKWQSSRDAREPLRAAFGDNKFIRVNNSEDYRTVHPDRKKEIDTEHGKIFKTVRKFATAPVQDTAWQEKEKEKRGVTKFSTPKAQKFGSKPKQPAQQPEYVPNPSELEQAKRLGVQHIGAGQFGAKGAEPTHVSNGGRLTTLAEERMKGKDPCWKGYQMVGKKKKAGKEVPNCVPVDEDFESFINEGKKKKIKLKKKLNQEDNSLALGYEFGNNGIGDEFGVVRSPNGLGMGYSLPMGGVSSMSESVQKWMNDEKTKARFEKKYGGLAELRLMEAANNLNKSLSKDAKSGPKLFTNIRDSWEALGGRDMGTVAKQGKDELDEVADDSNDMADQIAKKLDQLRSNAKPTEKPDDIPDIIGRMKINKAMDTFKAGLKDVKEGVAVSSPVGKAWDKMPDTKDPVDLDPKMNRDPDMMQHYRDNPPAQKVKVDEASVQKPKVKYKPVQPPKIKPKIKNDDPDIEVPQTTVINAIGKARTPDSVEPSNPTSSGSSTSSSFIKKTLNVGTGDKPSSSSAPQSQRTDKDNSTPRADKSSAPNATPTPSAAPKSSSKPSSSSGDMSDPATLIKKREGYISQPKWDVNAHRAGYGSDTVTRADGTIEKVKPGMSVSREDADRDLQRRIPEFQKKGVIDHVGQDAWDKLHPNAKSAVTSLAYNYGSIGKDYHQGLRDSIKNNDNEGMAREIEKYKGHNKGINAGRRQEEADIIRGAGRSDSEVNESSPAWQRSAGKNPEGGLNKKGIASYRAEHPGSKLSLAVTEKPSELKAGSKKAKRRLSFCRRMKGMKAKLTSAKTARDPDSRINKSLRKWNCEE